ncbi:hypothetical protein Baya_8284 [Bagarius yarrelli]|uniref:Uncharacterized protein n=1 Tax=Bagarius yarrelli TaxID=175774 RepID=A0A556U3R6_BAGYA|nr:hypothetical protein Baya_8284 [Bagarius yarrelli]
MPVGDPFYSEERVSFLRRSPHLGLTEIIQEKLKKPLKLFKREGVVKPAEDGHLRATEPRPGAVPMGRAVRLYFAGSCLGLGCCGGQCSREREIELPSGPEEGIGLMCQIRAARAAGEQMFQVECALHTRSGGTGRPSVAREQHRADLE